MQTTSPEPKGLGKNPVGSTVSGKITTRELDSTTPPRGDARLGTSPIRKRARKTTRRVCGVHIYWWKGFGKLDLFPHLLSSFPKLTSLSVSIMNALWRQSFGDSLDPG